MNLSELQKIVMQGEGLHIEFKKKATHPEKIVREMIAFANTKGGMLLVGVDDDKNIQGCKYPEEEIFAICEYLKLYCPMLEFRLERISISLKKEVLAFHIPEIAKKPFYIQDKDNPKIRLTYVRRADMTIKASREMEFVLRYRSNPQDWVFRYGWREQKVMEYLLNSPQITVAEAASLLQVPHKPAAITLVTLVRAGILQIIPTEHGDYFIVENKAFEQ